MLLLYTYYFDMYIRMRERNPLLSISITKKHLKNTQIDPYTDLQ